jgi:hypothetical protein
MGQVEWDDSCRILMQAAREISRELGPQSVTCTEHLLLALLINVRTDSLEVPQPEWSAVQKIMQEIAPPWTDAVVISPGCQTPRAKRVLETAIELAAAEGKPVHVEHVWSVLRQCESEKVAIMLSRLADVASSE